ncbi:MAG: glutamate--cysteine ligase [Acidobacteria bacterium]|nr:glutamate--cysteine ligase [Acidobacteriota bacterium]
MSGQRRWHLFEVTGVELEYMVVDSESLSVLPVADEVLRAVAGDYVSDVIEGEIAWSNELVLHVIELKADEPAPRLEGLPAQFDASVAKINRILGGLGGRLMPTAMHPWMDPARETRLWPHEYSPIYEAFDRIFGCSGHGWSNLQSLHLNLPFADDEEFGRLHAAVRLLLPLLPALAASSPVVEGRLTGSLDSRMEAYRGNAAKVPSVGGLVVPEAVFSQREYDEKIFQPMFREIAPHDPEGVLRDEFLNSRGAIARFSRGSIEIRVIDVQECPRADLAVAAATVAALRLLVDEKWTPYSAQKRPPVEPLARILRRAVVEAERAEIEDPAYLSHFGLSETCTAGELWRHLVSESFESGNLAVDPWLDPLEVILEEGTLARRIVTALGPNPTSRDLHRVYGRLANCLARGEMFG